MVSLKPPSHLHLPSPRPLRPDCILQVYIPGIWAEAVASPSAELVVLKVITALHSVGVPAGYPARAEHLGRPGGHPRVPGGFSGVPGWTDVRVELVNVEAVDLVPYSEGVAMEVGEGVEGGVQGGLARDEGPVCVPHVGRELVLAVHEASRGEADGAVRVEPAGGPHEPAMAQDTQGAKAQHHQSREKHAALSTRG